MEPDYVPDNSLSIEYTLRPISYTCWLMGIGVARPQKCAKAVTIIIRIFHLVVCSVIIVYNVIDLRKYFNNAHVYYHVFILIELTNFVIRYVSAYYTLYHGIRQYDMWPKLMDKIKDLDRKIRRETRINDEPIQKAEVAAILVTFVCCSLLLIINIIYSLITYSKILYVIDLTCYYIIARSLISSFVFDVVVYVLYYRFRTINKLICQLDMSFSAQWIAFKIRRIRELHTDVCELVSMVNDIYGLHLLICVTRCFITIIAILFKIYITVKEYHASCYFILLNTVYLILYTTQFGLMCWICTLARQESEKIGIIICEIALKCKPVSYDIQHETRVQLDLGTQLQRLINNQNLLFRNLDQDCIRREVKDFSIQLQHRRVAFTAYNFFEISNALFCGCIGVVITYLVISIQFAQSS
ncbi:uncharacterized protein LOC105829265 isoform X2 [Monomorium pharaonis]|uniref:uncharacterized protein LOC105829265 isoform X2 n=1 Tax=Monomorium pharaonis TaxID=307658 RepID=UPI001745F0A5|nr:uncharacterized protein LOC105829265 isoform X2 [Monomorium pharaonis]